MPTERAGSIPAANAVGWVSSCVTHLFYFHATSAVPQAVDCARAYPPYTRSGYCWALPKLMQPPQEATTYGACIVSICHPMGAHGAAPTVQIPLRIR